MDQFSEYAEEILKEASENTMKVVITVNASNEDDLVSELNNLAQWVKDPDYDTKELMDGTYQVGKSNVEIIEQ